MNILIFVLDDHMATIEIIDEIFKKDCIEGYHLFDDADKFMEALNDDVHIAVIDYWLNGRPDGLKICRMLFERNPQCFVIILSAQDQIKVVRDFMNSGADRYVMKQEAGWPNELVEYVRQGTRIVQRDLDYYYDLISRKAKMANEPD